MNNTHLHLALHAVLAAEAVLYHLELQLTNRSQNGGPIAVVSAVSQHLHRSLVQQLRQTLRIICIILHMN